VHSLSASLQDMDISVKYDDRDTQRPGFKFAEGEMKGVPLRVAVGARDMKKGKLTVARRDKKTKETGMKEGQAVTIENLLGTIQENIYHKALAFRNEHITGVNSYEEFKEILETKGGFVSCHWDGTVETEKR